MAGTFLFPPTPHLASATARGHLSGGARQQCPRPGEQGLTKGQDCGGHFLWVPSPCQSGLLEAAPGWQ